MSIEVLRSGNKPGEKTYEATCVRCNARLRWKHTDAKRVHAGDHRDGPFTQIDCPECGHTVTGYP